MFVDNISVILNNQREGAPSGLHYIHLLNFGTKTETNFLTKD